MEKPTLKLMKGLVNLIHTNAEIEEFFIEEFDNHKKDWGVITEFFKGNSFCSKIAFSILLIL